MAGENEGKGTEGQGTVAAPETVSKEEFVKLFN